jgi:hypothetical protein
MMRYGMCSTCKNSCKNKPVVTPEDNCKNYQPKKEK